MHAGKWRGTRRGRQCQPPRHPGRGLYAHPEKKNNRPTPDPPTRQALLEHSQPERPTPGDGRWGMGDGEAPLTFRATSLRSAPFGLLLRRQLPVRLDHAATAARAGQGAWGRARVGPGLRVNAGRGAREQEQEGGGGEGSTGCGQRDSEKERRRGLPTPRGSRDVAAAGRSYRRRTGLRRNRRRGRGGCTLSSWLAVGLFARGGWRYGS